MPDSFSPEIMDIASELKLRSNQVAQTLKLLGEGNTVPFITRYRKEQTGGLDETQIRRIQQAAEQARRLQERSRTILKNLSQRNLLTVQLRRQIEQASSLIELEDLYAPFRARKQTRADKARQAGLEPLADAIWQNRLDGPLGRAVSRYASAALSCEAVLAGTKDLLAERIANDACVRKRLRQFVWQTGRLSTRPGKADRKTIARFRAYHHFEEPVCRIPPHRILAINRGEKQHALQTRLIWDIDQALRIVAKTLDLSSRPAAKFLRDAVHDALKRLLKPVLDRDIRRELTNRAEAHAIENFVRSVKMLLLQPPVRNRKVLAIDPGFRTGCKMALLDEHGQLLEHGVLFLSDGAAARERIASIVQQFQCRLIAIGNGTASRETEQLVADAIHEHRLKVEYLVVNEAGASIYSASGVAREEFPDLDATVRGTISIGRRLIDPLSELVKIDPRHLGVGMYQHDIRQKKLQLALDQVIESCVNRVGVDLNVASASLLQYVSGFSPKLAAEVVRYRDQHGTFVRRSDLLDVPGLGKAIFRQAAGFLRLPDSPEPLDKTWVHPESYPLARAVLDRTGYDGGPWETFARRLDQKVQTGEVDTKQLASELGATFSSVEELLQEFCRPGRDPRKEIPPPIFRQQLMRLEELQPGMRLEGTVLNVVDFGAFVDVGIKEHGLIHISRMAGRFVASPHEILAVGERVLVWIESIDQESRRLSLSLLPLEPGTLSGS